MVHHPLLTMTKVGGDSVIIMHSEKEEHDEVCKRRILLRTLMRFIQGARVRD